MTQDEPATEDTRKVSFAVAIFDENSSLEAVLRALSDIGYGSDDLIVFASECSPPSRGYCVQLDTSIRERATLVDARVNKNWKNWQESVTFDLPSEGNDVTLALSKAISFHEWLASHYAIDLLAVLKKGYVVLFTYITDEIRLPDTCSILLRHSLHQVRTYQAEC